MSEKCLKGGWHDWYGVLIQDGEWERRCRKCGMRRKRVDLKGDNMEKIKCPHCGKINYTTLPELVSKCGYCGREFGREEQARGQDGGGKKRAVKHQNLNEDEDAGESGR